MALSSQILKMYNKHYPRIEHIRGSYRIRQLLNSILKPRAKKSIEKTIEFEVFNTSMSAASKTNQALSLYFGERDFKELNQLRYVLDNINEDEVFADVGASFGLFSAVIANNTEAEVHSFEPLRLNTYFQKLNQELYGYKFSVNRVAVAEKEGKAKLNISSTSHGQNYLAEKVETEDTESVDKIRLDKKLDKIDYVKIDVEGAEIKVLQGMERLLEEHKPVILLELHGSKMQNKFNSSKKEVLNFLSKKGFRTPDEIPKGNRNLTIEPK